MKFQRTTTILIIMVFVTAGLIAVNVYADVYIKREREVLRSSLQTIADQSALQGEYTALQDLLARTNDDRIELEKYVIKNDDDVARLLSELDTAAAEGNIQLATDVLEFTEDEESKKEFLNIQLTLEGSKTQIEKFVVLLERLPYAQTTRGLKLTTATNPQTGVQTATAQVSLRFNKYTEL